MKALPALSLLTLSLLAGLGACSRPAHLVFDPPEWSLGSVPSNRVARTEISLRNAGTGRVALRFVSTCDCLYVGEAPEQLAAGEAASVELAYDPEGQSGFVEAALIVVARQGPGESRLALRVQGKVLPYGDGSAP